MGSLPLHPAIVHVPLGLALVVPMIAAGLWWATRRGWLPLRSWAVVVALQAVLFAGALLALRTGEQDEERVERVVRESRIERHEERAEVFVGGAGGTLALATLVLLPFGDRVRRGIAAGAVVASVGVLGLGAWVGHSGGELVYREGAASAHVASSAAPRGGHVEHDDD